VNKLSTWLVKIAQRLEKRAQQYRTDIPALRNEFSELRLAGHALQGLLDWYSFETVLDIGSGGGEHARLLRSLGKKVTTLDLGHSVHFKDGAEQPATIMGDFNEIELKQSFDCVWCSHVLEHQVDPQRFLAKTRRVLNATGVLAITVPPRKDQIVGGHLSLWNGGLLLYHLILAGFDCSNARVLRYGYNVSVLVGHEPIAELPELESDSGDIRKLRPYFPPGIAFEETPLDNPFPGDVWSLNWG